MTQNRINSRLLSSLYMNDHSFRQTITYYKQHNSIRPEEIESFIQKCSDDFQEHGYDNHSFTGQQIVRRKNTPPKMSFEEFTRKYLLHSTFEPMNSHEGMPYNPFSFPPLQTPTPTSQETPIVTKQKVFIRVDINCFQDLLQLIRDNEYQADCEYNIDLYSLHKIKDELEELNKMIGLEIFKEEILNQLLYFAQNLHRGKNRDFMHTVLCGPPGTGKTEVAMILGKMYSKLGILKNNIFRKVSRNDLVAGYLGQTALKTKKVIEECLGGCLFIDEAYSLANDFSGDSFSRECIDVLCESLSAHKDELMVIIAGYEEQLDETFFKANQGLKSRFIWRFHLRDYNAAELSKIFHKKCSENEWTLGGTVDEWTRWIEKRKSHFIHFGRDMELLFSYSKISHGRRIYGKPDETAKMLVIEDVNCGFDKFIQNSSHKKREPPMGMYM